MYSTREMRRLQRDIHEVNRRANSETHRRLQLEQDFTLAKREAVILTDPASVKIVLPAQQADTPQLEATWHARLGILVSGQKIPGLADGRTLQLWLVPKAPGSKPLASLTVRPDAAGQIFVLIANPPEGMAETKALAVTEEPAGGSLQPTTTFLWFGGIR
jgi:anti-sigma-K factor RskA